MKHIRYIVCMAAVLLGSMAPLSAQIYDAEGQYVDTIFHDHVNRQAEDFVEASLLIAAPGDANFYSVFGHALIRLQCSTFGLDYVFDYSAENISDRFYEYLAGNLKMGLMIIPTAEYLVTENRSVYEYPLCLPPALKQELWQVLDNHQNDTPRPYDPITGSCAKMMFLYFAEACSACGVSTDFGKWGDEYSLTMREIGIRHTNEFPWSQYIYMTLAGYGYFDDVKNSNYEKIMFPQQLLERWKQTKVNDQPILISAPICLKEGAGVHACYVTPNMVAILVLVFSLISIALIYYAKLPRWIVLTDRVWNYAFLVLVSLLGCIVTYLVCFSKLPHTEWNWLLVPFNVLLPIAWHWRQYWALPYAAVVVVWMILMIAWPHTLVSPANLILAATEVVMLLKCGWLNRRKSALRKA